MVKNPMEKYEKIEGIFMKLKVEAGSDVVDMRDLRKEIAMNFGIIDYVAMKRFLISLDKLGLIDARTAGTNKVKLCL